MGYKSDDHCPVSLLLGKSVMGYKSDDHCPVSLLWGKSLMIIVLCLCYGVKV